MTEYRKLNKEESYEDPFKEIELPELLIKLAEGATFPSKANDTDSGYDLVATSIRYDDEYGFLEYGTGVFLHIPEGYEVNLLPRSSISKYDLFMPNSPGKVDETYRKELFFRFKITMDYETSTFSRNIIKCYRDGVGFFYPKIYQIGDKIGQMEMRKKHVYSLKQVDDVEDLGRGGFGSTDTKYDYSSYVDKDLVKRVEEKNRKING